MRTVFGTVLAAAVGGGITAAVLLGSGAGGRDRTVTVVERSGVGTSLASASGGTTSPSAADVYAGSAAGVVFIRAARLREPDGPFEVADASGTDATGSGFLIDDTGTILTTAHVVAEATELQVTLDEETTLPARVIGTDPDTDLALLKVDAPDDVVLKRLSGRRQCSNGHLYHVEFDPPKRPDVCDQDGKPLARRKDDEPETVSKRLATYHKSTEPLKEYYEERGLLRRFDGTRDKTEVHDDIRATLATLRLEERL